MNIVPPAIRHDPINALRLRLLGNGYEPIPVVGPDAPGKSPGKRPGIKEWQTVPIAGAPVSVRHEQRV